MKRAILGALAVVVLAGCELAGPLGVDIDGEDVVQISAIRIGYINSVWLTYVDVTIANGLIVEMLSPEAIGDPSTIKYATFSVKAYNRVGDPIQEDIWGYYEKRCQYTGPLVAGASETQTWEIGYFSGVDHVTAQLESVTMMDGKYYSIYDAEVVSSQQ